MVNKSTMSGLVDYIYNGLLMLFVSTALHFLQVRSL